MKELSRRRFAQVPLPVLMLAMSLPVAGAAACGGGNPQGKTTPVASVGSVASGAPHATVAADTSQVPEPQNLIAVGRIASLSKALKTLHAWSQLPMPKDDAVTEMMTSEAVGGLVDLDQSIDFALAVVGKGTQQKEQFAVSAAVKDLEKAKSAFQEHFKLVPGDNGIIAIEGLGRPSSPHASGDDDDDDDDGPKKPKNADKPKDDDNEERRHCWLAPSFGTASTRLVCGWTKSALVALGPYLTRTVTRQSSTSDLHVDLKLSSLRPTITEQKPMIRGMVGSIFGLRGYNTGVRDLVGGFGMDVADLALDLDSASIDAQLSEQGATATLTSKFAGQSATLTRLAVQHPDRTDVPPASFWQLPGDAEFAMFHRGVDPKEFDGARDMMVNVVGSQLAKDGVGDPDKQAMLDAVKKLTSGAAGVYASGLNKDAVRRTFADQRQKDRSWTPNGDRAEYKRAATEAILGWRVFGVEEASPKFIGAAKDLVAEWNKPAVQKAYKTKYKDGPMPVVRLAPMPKGVTLPKDAVHLELELYPYYEAPRPVTPPSPPRPGQPAHPPTPKPPSTDKDKPGAPLKPLKIHAIIAADGGRTWITISADEALLVSKANAVMPTGSESEKLGRRQGLEMLRSAKVGAGGFVTQRGFPSMSQLFSVLFGNTFYGVGEHYDDLTAAKFGGATPIPFSFTAQPNGGPVVSSVQLPKAAVEDFVVSFIKRMGG